MGELTIRTLRPQDVTTQYVAWMNDPLVNQFLESRFKQHSLEGIQEFVRTEFESATSVLFGVFLGESYRHIGNIKLGSINLNHGTAEVGFLIGEKDCWGRGYASRAISLAADFAFGAIQLRKLTAGAYALNIGSIRALEKADFTIEARLTGQVVDSTGTPQDVVRLARFQGEN